MAKYLSVFDYTGEAWSRMVANPGDRSEAARKLIEDMGGTMECFYWMLGDHDGVVIYEAPDEATAAAIVGGVRASQLVRAITTHQLVGPQVAGEALGLAARARAAYRPPGAPSGWRTEYDSMGTSAAN
ncbi:MAG: hypothetical protein QOK40_40 [Miltoncostaeaceae bacterium]|jgi:uncharacterized protein with GYD domain|nr:hypothetical protein [Miltoncostaeaceae bacterium]